MKHSHAGKSSESILDKEAVLQSLEIHPGETILDAGCGNGYMAKEFARLLDGSGTVYALDADEPSIEVLQTETEGSNIRAMLTDISVKTPLEDSSVDLVYLGLVFHGFSQAELKGFQAEVKRILKPRGRLAIVEIDKVDSPFGPPLDIRYSPEEMRLALQLTARATVEVGQYFYMQFFENTPQ